jgi:hypothetical protein
MDLSLLPATRASMNKDRGSDRLSLIFCCMQLITIDVPRVFSRDIYIPVASL